MPTLSRNAPVLAGGVEVGSDVFDRRAVPDAVGGCEYEAGGSGRVDRIPDGALDDLRRAAAENVDKVDVAPKTDAVADAALGPGSGDSMLISAVSAWSPASGPRLGRSPRCSRTAGPTSPSAWPSPAPESCLPAAAAGKPWPGSTPEDLNCRVILAEDRDVALRDLLPEHCLSEERTQDQRDE